MEPWNDFALDGDVRPEARGPGPVGLGGMGPGGVGRGRRGTRSRYHHFGNWLIRGSVGFRRLGFDEQEHVVELDVCVADMTV